MITASERDHFIVRRILKYCGNVDEIVRRCDNSYANFKAIFYYRDSVSMSIQQIGELIKHLSDEFKSSHTDIPWAEIRGMRNRFAHDYYQMNNKVIWNTAINDIPKLRIFCESVLKENP